MFSLLAFWIGGAGSEGGPTPEPTPVPAPSGGWLMRPLRWTVGRADGEEEYESAEDAADAVKKVRHLGKAPSVFYGGEPVARYTVEGRNGLEIIERRNERQLDILRAIIERRIEIMRQQQAMEEQEIFLMLAASL